MLEGFFSLSFFSLETNCNWNLCFSIFPQRNNGGNDGCNAGVEDCRTNHCCVNEPCCTIEKQKESCFLLAFGKDGEHEHQRTNDGEHLQQVMYGDFLTDFSNTYSFKLKFV